MTALPRRPEPTTLPRMTEAEYLASEDASEDRHEFRDGIVVAMAGTSEPHGDICVNITAASRQHLRGGPCRVSAGEQRVLVETSRRYVYLDLVVVCGEREFVGKPPKNLVNPQVVNEVLSPSTERYDRGGKFHSHQKIPSLKEYVLVSQSHARVERYVRETDGDWRLSSVIVPAATFEFATVPASIPMAEIDDGVSTTGVPGAVADDAPIEEVSEA